MRHRSVAVDRRLVALFLFRSCSARELRRVDQLSTCVHVEAGREVCCQREISREFFVVLDGVLVVTRDRATVSTLGSGDWFGEIGLAGGRRRTAAVRTLTPAKLLVFDLREYNSMRATCPSVRAALDGAMPERVWGATFDEEPTTAEAERVTGTAE